MQGVPGAVIMFGQVMDLGMAVMTRGDGILSAGILDLFDLQPSILTAGFGKSRLQETTTAAATVVVGLVGRHVDEIFLADHLFHHIAQIIGHGITEGFSYQLTGILDGESDFQVLVPV
jgi:hypothetical protein